MEGLLFRTAGFRPKRATRFSAGYDVFLNDTIFLDPGEKRLVDSGVYVDVVENGRLPIAVALLLPALVAALQGSLALATVLAVTCLAVFVELQDCCCRRMLPFVAVKEKSGVATKLSVSVFRGVVDCDYRDSVKLEITNRSTETVVLCEGRAVCQLVIIPCLTTLDDEVPTQERTGGFGSTERSL